MMTSPIVSVCMASYNHAAFIRTAVESVLQQSFNDWELVITDDGSRDGTLAALDGIKDDRLRIEAFPENRSACVALNNCIRRARGRFIAVLNSDDAWAPEKLAKQVAVMDEQPHTAAVFTLVNLIDERGTPLPPENAARIFDQPNRDRAAWLRRLLFEGNCLCHPSVLVRSAIYREVGLYDELLAQLPDFDMWIRICLRHDIHVLQERLTFFRLLDHDRNASGNRPEVRVRTMTENMLVCLKTFRSHPVELKALVQEPGACLPPSMAAGELVWRYDQARVPGDWQACKRFIDYTGRSDPFRVLEIERLLTSQPSKQH